MGYYRQKRKVEKMKEVFKSLFEEECYAYLDNNSHINGIVEKDVFSGYFKVLDLG